MFNRLCIVLSFVTASLFHYGQTSPLQHPPTDGIKSSVRTVYEFPNETWVENLAVRKTGEVLVTLSTTPEVWEINTINHEASQVYKFPNALSVLGIVEFKHDVFAVVVGNLSLTTLRGTKGSWSLWTIDMSRPTTPPKVQKAADVADAVFLNGVTTQPSAPDSVLVADSALGVIFQVNLSTGTSAILIDSPALKPNASAFAQIGVNGIHSRGKHLYFSNSFQVPLLGRFLLNENGTAAAGPPETILHAATFPTNLGGMADDFALDAHGNAFVATDPSNSLVRVTPGGEARIVVGGVNESVVAGDTSAAFGRTWRDRDTVYVTTNGGLAYPPPGGIVGGKLVAVDVASSW